MIKIYDNFISTEKCLGFYNYCLSAPYYYGEKDRSNTLPTGMVSNLTKNNRWFNFFASKIEEKCGLYSPYRSYINLFFPGEKPYYHVDGKEKDITFLFYPTLEWDINEGGETKFYINNQVKCITPISNRAILFSGDILHSASSFRSKPRFTLAMKYRQ
jgi:Rps23 Pro-64 3,4-dihydroxylase Tpa1-like proline 4-hydroxylase